MGYSLSKVSARKRRKKTVPQARSVSRDLLQEAFTCLKQATAEMSVAEGQKWRADYPDRQEGGRQSAKRLRYRLTSENPTWAEPPPIYQIRWLRLCGYKSSPRVFASDRRYFRTNRIPVAADFNFGHAKCASMFLLAARMLYGFRFATLSDNRR